VKNSTLFLFAFLILFGCQNETVFNEYQDFAQQEWYADSLATFQFNIDDAALPYNLYYSVRNDLSYPFYNFYTKYELTDSEGKILRSSLHEADLMHPITGAPLGTGESIFDNNILLLKDFQFPASGKYQFSMKQYMRKDTLSGVLAVGLAIEQAKD